MPTLKLVSITATDQQIQANRENAQFSAGPSTPEGKARFPANSIRHGRPLEQQPFTKQTHFRPQKPGEHPEPTTQNVQLTEARRHIPRILCRHRTNPIPPRELSRCRRQLRANPPRRPVPAVPPPSSRPGLQPCQAPAHFPARGGRRRASGGGNPKGSMMVGFSCR